MMKGLQYQSIRKKVRLIPNSSNQQRGYNAQMRKEAERQSEEVTDREQSGGEMMTRNKAKSYSQDLRCLDVQGLHLCASQIGPFVFYH